MTTPEEAEAATVTEASKSRLTGFIAVSCRQEGFAVAAVISLTLLCLLASLFVGLLATAWFYVERGPVGEPAEQEFSAVNAIVSAGIIAPIVETGILVWLIALLQAFVKAERWIVLLIGLGSGLAHLPAKSHGLFVISIGFGFALMTWYILKRMPYTSLRVVYFEATIIHSLHNTIPTIALFVL